MKKFLTGWLCWIALSAAYGQTICMDRGIRVAGLWCFPLTNDSLTYLYLPNDAKLALDDSKMPQFSFVRYAHSTLESKTTAPSNENRISEVGGGGVLHFLVTYETAASKIEQAQEALREQLNQPNLSIRGPLVFKEGRYSLISATLRDGMNETEPKILASGNAPVLEGGKIALSFEMPAKNATLLAESFKMATPDISLIFDFTFGGLSDAFDALITVHWAEIALHERFKAGASVYFVSGEVEKSLDDLIQKNAIAIQTSGSDVKMEALIQNVYPTLMQLLFQPAAPEKVADKDNLTNIISHLANDAKSLSPIGAHVSYECKQIRKEGQSILSFNSRKEVERHHLITFNIGHLYQKYGQDTRFFNTMSLEDFVFQQREIEVMLDGNLVAEFDKLMNNVTVTVRKLHENQTTTVREVLLTKAILNANHFPKMAYGAIGDTDKMQWLQYDYKIKYSFVGGKQYETDWITQSNAMINLAVPYQRRIVRLDGDMAVLKKQGVRTITVRLEYPFFGETQKLHLTLKPNDLLKDSFFEMTLPQSVFEYQYFVTWTLQNGETKNQQGKTDAGFLWVDNLN